MQIYNYIIYLHSEFVILPRKCEASELCSLASLRNSNFFPQNIHFILHLRVHIFLMLA